MLKSKLTHGASPKNVKLTTDARRVQELLHAHRHMHTTMRSTTAEPAPHTSAVLVLKPNNERGEAGFQSPSKQKKTGGRKTKKYLRTRVCIPRVVLVCLQSKEVVVVGHF